MRAYVCTYLGAHCTRHTIEERCIGLPASFGAIIHFRVSNKIFRWSCNSNALPSCNVHKIQLWCPRHGPWTGVWSGHEPMRCSSLKRPPPPPLGRCAAVTPGPAAAAGARRPHLAMTVCARGRRGAYHSRGHGAPVSPHLHSERNMTGGLQSGPGLSDGGDARRPSIRAGSAAPAPPLTSVSISRYNRPALPRARRRTGRPAFARYRRNRNMIKGEPIAAPGIHNARFGSCSTAANTNHRRLTLTHYLAPVTQHGRISAVVLVRTHGNGHWAALGARDLRRFCD